MDVPKLFISSSYYDLKHLRSMFELFGQQLGYKVTLFEKGHIVYPAASTIKEAIFNEINASDIIISIIGSRYGSMPLDSDFSFSEEEVRHALEIERQILFFVEPNVLAEYGTYKQNQSIADDITWHHVESIKTFEYLDYIHGLSRNNAVFEFNSPDDLLMKLRLQLAGLFKNFMHSHAQLKRDTQLINLVDAIDRLERIFQIVHQAESTNQKVDEGLLSNIMHSNHPVYRRLQNILNVPIRVIFENLSELNAIMTHFGFRGMSAQERPPIAKAEDYYYWLSIKSTPKSMIRVSKELFDDMGNLKKVMIREWNENMIIEKLH